MGKMPDFMDQSICYLVTHLSFVRPQDPVLLCYSDRARGSVGWLFAQAVERIGAKPVWMEPDLRWLSLLRQAFSTRACVIVGSPLVILGLAKLAKFKGTPLYIRHAITTGYSCDKWMREALIRGLDCQIWGCFDPQGLIAGFSCGNRQGVHLWQQRYDHMILESGELVLQDKSANEMIRTGQTAWVSSQGCPCGSQLPLLRDLRAASVDDPMLQEQQEALYGWSSILDCRIRRGEYGLELELVVFPGEQLPALGTFARQVIRNWDPDGDIPFDMEKMQKSSSFSPKNH